MQFFFGMNPIAVLGTILSVICLIVGFALPGATNWLQIGSTTVVICCLLAMKWLVDRDARRFAVEPSIAKADRFEQILSGEFTRLPGERNWELARRGIGSCLILCGLGSMPFMDLVIGVKLDGANYALAIAATLAAVFVGYELVVRP